MRECPCGNKKQKKRERRNKNRPQIRSMGTPALPWGSNPDQSSARLSLWIRSCRNPCWLWNGEQLSKCFRAPNRRHMGKFFFKLISFTVTVLLCYFLGKQFWQILSELQYKIKKNKKRKVILKKIKNNRQIVSNFIINYKVCVCLFVFSQRNVGGYW